MVVTAARRIPCSKNGSRSTEIVHPKQRARSRNMKVGVIGAGKMGATFAKRLGDAGHDVFITSRKIDEADQVAQSTPGKGEGSAAIRARQSCGGAHRRDALSAAG